MKGIIISIALILIIFTSASSQEIKTINATEQSWSGGVCCRYGTNYNITIKTFKDKITPDTVWIRGNYYPLDIDTGGYENNCIIKRDSLHHTATYSINVGESHDERDNMNPPDTRASGDTARKNNPHADYFGAAIISYQYNGRKYYYKVKEFKVLEPIAYP